VDVGLEPVAEGDARHRKPGPRVVDQLGEQLALVVVELVEVLGHDGAEEDGAPARAAERQVGVAERDAPGRHVPPGVTDVQLGE
jgi:hypothetical protein